MRTIAPSAVETVIGALLLALLLATGPNAAAGPSGRQDGEPERAYVAVASERGEGYVGEAVRVRVRVGFDAAFLAEHAIQPFRRALDVPAQVEAPWLDELAGARLLAPADAVAPGGDDAAKSAGATIALNDRVATARELAPETRDGARFRVFELERTFVPLEPGVLALAAPTLRFAYATAFEDDLVAGRAPIDRRDAKLTGEPLALTVLPLPPGAPDGFTGAVGRYAAHATAEPREVDVGGSIKLTLKLERADGAPGDLFGFGAPELPELDGLRSRGHLESRSDGARELVFDLVARAPGERAIPALTVAFFDPERAAWGAARTEPIALRVRGEVAADEPGADRNAGAGEESGADGDGLPARGITVAVLAIVGAVVLLAWLAIRRARSRPAA